MTPVDDFEPNWRCLMSDVTRDDDLASSLALLAPEVDMPAARTLFERERGRVHHRRWLAFSAAAVVIGLGVVGLFVVAGEGPNSNVPATEPTAPITEPTPATTPTVAQLRFADPLEPGTVATLEPAPASPVAAYALDAYGDEWAFGRNASSNVWVLSDNEWVGSLTVIDQAVPWETATDGYIPTDINGIDAIIDDASSTVALRLDSGGTRVIRSGGDGPSQPDQIETAIELAELVGADPVDAALTTDRFVVPAGTSSRSPVVRYGNPDAMDNSTEVIVSRLDRTPTEDELRWMATAMSQGNPPEPINATAFQSTLDEGQRSLIELVSPLDVVTILAPPNTDMTALRDSLQFGSVEQAGLTVERINPDPPINNVVASGEHDWGRWQVAASDDGRCRSVTHAVWTAGDLSPIPAGASTCDSDTPFGQTICAATGPGQTLVIALGADASAVAVELDGQPINQPIMNGDGGAAVLVDGVSPGPNPVTITIDGTATQCTPV